MNCSAGDREPVRPSSTLGARRPFAPYEPERCTDECTNAGCKCYGLQRMTPDLRHSRVDTILGSVLRARHDSLGPPHSCVEFVERRP
jgi:hypothetical protein